MTKGLYIGATRAFSGKNMLSVGIGLRLQKEDVKVGYMKPVGSLPAKKNGEYGDEDAFFIQEILDLDQPASLVTPALITQDFRMRALTGHVDDLLPNIAAAYKKLEAECDLMLVCGANNLLSHKFCHLDGIRIVREMNFKAIIVDRLTHEVGYDELLAIKEELGDNMLGTVINDIPVSFMAEIKDVILPYLKRNGIPILGVLPSDPLMGSIRAHELAEKLEGRLVATQARANRMVEHFLIGTMQVENFMTHFRRHPNSAVIVGGDRADVQLVAIEGNCPCLVLTGNLFPNDIILSRADTLNVPIFMVRQDTYTVAKKMEELLYRHKMRDVMKIRQGAQIVSNNLDFLAIRQGLGI